MTPYFISIFLFLNLLSSQNYKWPTDASYGLTSAFAEYRENRFHAGIDISTWNKEGYKVFAIDSGYVYRIWTQPYGYGRALYIKLTDGRIVVYGHLKRYNKKIESYIRSIQKRTKKYNQNVYLKRSDLPVSKGEIVAFTGSTGIGTPHLHFEIRENMNTNLHTLQFYPWFKDKIFPAVAGLSVMVLNDTSLVNGHRVFKEIRLEAKKKLHQFQAIDTILIDGQAGFAINTFDKNYNSTNTTGVEELSLFVNDELIFNSRFRKTLYSQNHYVNLDRNFFFVKYFGKRYQNLFLHPDNKLNAYMHKSNGIIDKDIIGKNSFNYKIIIKDFKKNTVEITGFARFESQNEIDQSLAIKDLFQKNPVFYKNRLISIETGEILFDPKIKFDTTILNQKIEFWDKKKSNLYKADQFIFQTDPSDLYESTYVTHYELDKAPFPKVDYKTPIIYFVPFDLLLKNRITIKHIGKLAKQEAIYSWNERKEHWDFRRFKEDNEGHSLTERSLELYTVIKDSNPPKIIFIHEKKKKSLFLIKITDDLSGIRDEENYELYSGNQQIIAEYDYEDNLLRIESDDIKRNQFLKLYLLDNVGNATTDSIFVR